ncbi:efflux RND transporter periplasmic adaptor subunit [Microbacterium radiodurans]|uniref:HlyD family efflux transporter periplasmic adaptor subunit n=1 Tax=Microbacterium radiodurans TaxID=661398 RepID=A0A5J5ITD5_9MICO|nr:efflux RND transporter periplasmic adaptor subunit [Microbacterium radiodurans]KAA9085289.1 hypothetical protein F6B42_12510 [Microbacterium radiodurans]
MSERPESDAATSANASVDDLLVDPAADPEPSIADASAAPAPSPWRAVVSRNRALWITAGIAVLALVGGLLLGRFVMAPASATADDAPAPGLVTVPVAFGPLSNDVTIRSDVGFADPVEVKIDTSAIAGPAVVTGQVPELGAELGPLSVALEVAGRPVITLPGELPAYRTLRFGVSGPDVVQFKEAMRAVGIDAGDPANDVFDEQAAGAVTALYAAVGYTGPASEEDGESAVRGAQDGVRSAEQALTSARAALTTARSGASAVEIREADNQVASARRTLDAARATDPNDAVGIGNAEDELALAQLRRQQLDVGRDTSAERGAVDAAASQLEQAQRDLTRARQEALPALPAGEVLYLTELPRRVDAVTAERGSILSGAAMTVSGATVALTGSAAEADAALLTVGATATFALPDGAEHTATVSEVTPGANGETRWQVTLQPADLTPEQIAQLQGTNVRVVIAVGATAGDVLSVPAAALTAGPGGETRVEVVDGDPRDSRAATRLVVVETGLSAGGAVEVRAVDGELATDDLVVVGR